MGSKHLPPFVEKWLLGHPQCFRKILVTLHKYISLNMDDKEEKQEENKVLYAFVRLPLLFCKL